MSRYPLYKKPKKDPGRPKQEPSKAQLQALRKMAIAICTGVAHSERQAARQVTGDVKGGPETKGRQLRRLYGSRREDLEDEVSADLEISRLESQDQSDDPATIGREDLYLLTQLAPRGSG